MKIVHIIPGSGGTFYCQNCMRDNQLIKSLKAEGHDVVMVPMYLPLNVDVHGLMGDTPVFYGAINVYLKEKVPLYRHAPVWLEKLFDSESLLQMAAKKAGSTRAAGLEEMTINTLLGEKGSQASELEHMVNYLNEYIQPDIVHLSNALLLGLAKRLKQDVGASVVCSLQDENEWIDPMAQPYQKKVWDLMGERAKYVDAFIAASGFYADKSKKHMGLPDDNIHVVYGGVDVAGYKKSDLPMDPPTIGFLCRLNEYFGLGIIVDAFIKLKNQSKFTDTKLVLTGGYTGDDKPFVQKMLKLAEKAGFKKDITILEEFDKASRIKMLSKLTLLSVPVLGGEAFGAYQVEALAAGVPIVQPNVGGYPEFIEKTGGGLIYNPNTGEKLAASLEALLLQPEKMKEMGTKGREIVYKEFTMKKMAANILSVYEGIL
jgi:glycosyltransferase involved in cell wall biosynthesis